MKSRAKSFLRALLVSVTLLIVAVIAGLIPLPLGVFSAAISAQVREATGLDLVLDGPVVLRLGPRARLDIADLKLTTLAGDALLELEEGRVGFSLLALARGRLHFRDIEIAGVRVDHCTPLPETSAGQAAAASEPPVVIVQALDASSVELVCNGESAGLGIDRLTAAAPADGPIRIDASVNAASNAARVTAVGGTLAELLGQQVFPFDATLAMEQGHAHADGVFEWDAGAPLVEASVVLDVADALALADAFDLSIPDIGAVDIEAGVSGNAERLEITELTASLGATQLTATGTIDMPVDRLHIAVSAVVGQLDLGPFMTATPTTGSEPADFTALFDTLQRVDAVADARIDEIVGLPVKVRAATVEAKLVGGVVELTSAKATVLGGQVALTGKLDTLMNCPSLDLAGDLDSIALSGLHDAGWLDASVDGQVASAGVTISSCGRGLAEYVDQLSATATVTEGRLVLADDLPVDIAALHVGLEQDKPINASATITVAGERIDMMARTGTLQAMGGEQPWPISLDAEAAGSELRVEGKARTGPNSPGFDVTARLSAPRIGALHSWFGITPDAEESLLATTRLRLDDSRLVAEDIRIDLDGTDLSGSVTWFHAATPETLAVQLRSDFVDVDKILRTIEAPENAGEEARQSDGPPGGRELPPVDIDLAFAAIRGGRVDITDLTIEGRLRAGLVDNARVSALVEDELSLRGQLDVDVRQLPATLVFDAEAENADLGRLLRRLGLVDDLSMRADALVLRVNAMGDSPRSALANLSVDTAVQGFAWDIPRRRSDADLEVRLETLDLSMRPGEPLGASTSGVVDGVPVELWLESSGLDTVLGDDAELPLRIVAAAEDDVAMIDLLLDRSGEDEIRGRIELSGQVLARRDRDLATLRSPLEDYALQGNVLVNDAEATVSGLDARLGSSVVTGNASLRGDGRQRLAIELRSPRLQADDWAYLPAFGRGEVTASSDTTVDENVAEPTESQPAREGPLFVINQLIEGYQEQYDLDLDVAIEELYVGEDLVGGAELGLRIDAQDFRLQPLTIRLPGGSLDAEYGWRNEDGRVNAEFRARADNLVYAGLLKLVDPTLDAGGILYVDVDLRAESDWSTDTSEFDLLMANADGTIDIAVWPQNFEAGVLDLWTENLVLALLPVPTAGESSRLNCVTARLEAKDGLLKTKNVLMDSTGTIIRGRGKIDLNHRELDLLVTPQAKREKFLSASTPIRVTGPLNDFQVGVEPGGFIGTMIKWYTNLIYVPFKWLTGQRFPEDGTQTCFDVMDWELTPDLEAYFRERDFSSPPRVDWPAP